MATDSTPNPACAGRCKRDRSRSDGLWRVPVGTLVRVGAERIADPAMTTSPTLGTVLRHGGYRSNVEA